MSIVSRSAQRPFAAAILIAAAAAGAALSAASPAQAQESSACQAAKAQKKKSPFSSRFGRLMGAAGMAAITGQKASATAAADAAARDVVDTAREQTQAEIAAGVACAGTAAAADAAAAPAPASARQAQSALAYPNQIPVPAEAKAAKQAFDAFGKVACKDCEGGYAYDSWARQAFASELRGQYNGWEKKLGAIKAGETISWNGAESSGTIRLLAEERIGGFDCKRLGYQLSRAGSSASRDGLICWGKANQFAGSDSWVEVY